MIWYADEVDEEVDGVVCVREDVDDVVQHHL